MCPETSTCILQYFTFPILFPKVLDLYFDLSRLYLLNAMVYVLFNDTSFVFLNLLNTECYNCKIRHPTEIVMFLSVWYSAVYECSQCRLTQWVFSKAYYGSGGIATEP